MVTGDDDPTRTVKYRLLGAIVWKPYHWIVYRQAEALRPFMIRRRIWGGERITRERREQIERLWADIRGTLDDEESSE
jgi:hypothetical protein